MILLKLSQKLFWLTSYVEMIKKLFSFLNRSLTVLSCLTWKGYYLNILKVNNVQQVQILCSLTFLYYNVVFETNWILAEIYFMYNLHVYMLNKTHQCLSLLGLQFSNKQNFSRNYPCHKMLDKNNCDFYKIKDYVF